MNFFHNANESLKGISHEECPFVNNVSVDSKNNLAIVRVAFNNHHYNWEKINQFIIDNKFYGYNVNFIRETPITKDFNDDLKAIKGIHRDYRITFDENKNPILAKIGQTAPEKSEIKNNPGHRMGM